MKILDGLTSCDVAVFDDLDGGYCHRAGADPLSLVLQAGAVGGDDFLDLALERMRAADAAAHQENDMADTADETSLREQLVVHYRRVEALGLNELSSGNLSVRFGDRMLISPNGASAETITEDSIVDVSFDGEWSGERRPSSEWRMHAAIYARHAEAGAVVHTHSDYCVAVASHLMPLPGFHYLVGVFGGNDVPCVPYSTFGTQALADDAAEALTDRTACLLGQHGMICRAPNLTRAVKQAHRLEIMCRQYVLARQLGEPKRLTDAEWEEFFGRARENRGP